MSGRGNAGFDAKGFADRVAKRREAAGLSQAGLARRMQALTGTASPATNFISRIESGQHVPTVAWAAVLADALGLTTEQLLGRPARTAGSRDLQAVGGVGAGPGRDDPADRFEAVRVPDLGLPGDVVVYRVRGESMADRGIRDGDWVLVRTHPEHKPGDLVVAYLHDAGGMVLKPYFARPKRLEWTEGKESRRHFIADGDVIFGVYIGVYRLDGV